MKALGITAGMQFSALKKIPDEYISVAPLVQVTGELTQAARRIFDQWFDMYSESDGTWSTMSAGYFI
jgi:Cys-tRNA synthase (O-phospho-L-seryl-tRNA:Cys-tRNA synthase)